MTWNWILFFVTVHITAVIVGFGPTFAFPFIGMTAQQMPQHMPLAIRVANSISKKVIIPLAIVAGLSGIAIVLIGGISLLKSPYLLVALLLYLVMLYNGIVILGGNGDKMAEMIDKMAAAPAAAAGGPAPPGVSPSGAPSAPAGPPPEFMKLIDQNRLVGTINHVLLLTVILLMIIKPGGLHLGPLFG